MGSSQEKQDVEKLEKTNEGAIIKDISSAPMNQDIYVCGNYDNKFFQDYFIKDFRLPTKPNITYYDNMGKHKEISD